jgi:ATP synthase regulation protein NCA2
MKTKLLVLLNSMEDMMNENEFNLRVMATVPAFLLVYGVWSAVKPLYNAVRGVKSRSATAMALRFTFLGMERLLNLRTSGTQHHQTHAEVPRVSRQESGGSSTPERLHCSDAGGNSRHGASDSGRVTTLDALDLVSSAA